jgi:hypothetical protein
MGVCVGTEEPPEQHQQEELTAEERQRQQRQEQLAGSRTLELWLVEPAPSRKINARAIETAAELAHRLGSELEIGEAFWNLLEVEFSDMVLEPATTLEQAGIQTVHGCQRVC